MIETKNILIIGNGFDLRTGVKSSFRDFISYVILGCILHNYRNPKALIFMDADREIIKHIWEFEKDWLRNLASVREKVLPEKEKYKELRALLKRHRKNCSDCSILAHTELGKYIFKHFSSQALNELISPIQWDNNKTEEENHEIETCLIEQYSQLDSDLRVKSIIDIIDSELKKQRNNLNLWSDVETVIELLVTRSDELQKKFNVKDGTLPELDNEGLKSISEGLDLFENLFTEYLTEEQKKIKIDKKFADDFFNDIIQKHINSLRQRSHGTLANTRYTDEDIAQNLLFVKNPTTVINYNYTDIAKRLYDEIRPLPKNSGTPETSEQIFTQMRYGPKEIKIIHVNGSLASKNQSNEFQDDIVIGYTNLENKDVPKDLYHFEKSCRRIIKNSPYIDIESLIGDDESCLFNLLIIGHSCCLADGDILGKLLTHDKLDNAVILCYDTTALVSAFNNIKKIISLEEQKEPKKQIKFADLMNYTYSTKIPGDEKPNHNIFFAVDATNLKSKILYKTNS